MKKYLKNLFAGAGAAVSGSLLLAVSAYVVSSKLLSAALDREAPPLLLRHRGVVSGIKSFEEKYSLLKEFSVRLSNCGCEDVEIMSRDGVSLCGHWYECENAQRIIIAMHGWRSDWAHDFGAISEFWHKNGCSVLYAEQRGQNKSGGDHIGFGMLERYDCLDWVEWVSGRVMSDLPIYLGGISMGATTVLMAGGLDLPESVHGIIADCGFTSPKAIWKHVSENNLHIPYAIHGPLVEAICKKKIRMRSDACSSVEAMKICRVPVMFIHGTEDSFVPVKMTYENYIACVAPKRLFIVPGANHAMSYFLDRAGYESAVRSFWQDFDSI